MSRWYNNDISKNAEVVIDMITKQIVFTKPYVAELLDSECLSPKENEVTVSLEYSAISSGTEKANLIGQRPGTNVSEDDEPVFPRSAGYSAAGVVTEIGTAVKNVKVGTELSFITESTKRISP